jgi:hypothetical protein
MHLQQQHQDHQRYQDDSNIFYDQISPGPELQAHTHTRARARTRTHAQTDDNDIWPYTIQEHNERTSMEFNLAAAQSTTHEPPEDVRKYGPKHVRASF